MLVWRRAEETAGFREHGGRFTTLPSMSLVDLSLQSSAPVSHEPKLTTPRLLCPQLQGAPGDRGRTGPRSPPLPRGSPLGGHLGLACPSIQSHCSPPGGHLGRDAGHLDQWFKTWKITPELLSRLLADVLIFPHLRFPAVCISNPRNDPTPK